jgi:hypothetical protein
MSEPTQEPKKRGKNIDWDAIEGPYRAGVLSVREIARKHDISEKAIRKHAEEFGWERDLTAKVQQKVRNDLVRKQVRTADPATEREIVEQAAAVQVHVVREHQKLGSRGMRTVQLLSQRLDEAIANSDEITDEISSEADGEKRRRMLRAVSLGSLITLAANLGNAARTWIGIERQAFNIPDDETPPPPPTPMDELTDDEIDRRIAELAKEAGIGFAAVRESAQDAGK